MNVAQDVADLAASFLGVHLSNGFDRLDPTRWIRWDIDRFLVIFLDATDGFAQRAMQRRVVGEIFANGIVDAIEFTFDDAFFRLAAGRQQNVAVACLKTAFGSGYRFRSNPKAAVQAAHRSLDGLMCCVANEVQCGSNQNNPE